MNLSLFMIIFNRYLSYEGILSENVNIENFIVLKTKLINFSLKRQDEVISSRVRIGHSIFTYSYLLKG